MQLAFRLLSNGAKDKAGPEPAESKVTPLRPSSASLPQTLSIPRLTHLAGPSVSAHPVPWWTPAES